MKKFVIASTNEHKIFEFQEMLKPFDIKVVPYKTLLKNDFEVEETGKTFAENAKLKAEAICEKTGLPTFADDSGFCVKDLGGFPGLVSSRFAEEIGGYENAYEEIKNRLGGRCSEAKFVCNIAFAQKGEETVQFEGQCYGFTVFPARGEDGFGYDPIFVPNSYGKTFAEMSEDEKNSISHRALAVEKFVDYLSNLEKKKESGTAVKPLKTKASKIEAKVEESTETPLVLEVKKEENFVLNDNIFNVEVDEKFDMPNIPFVSDSDEEN